MKHLAILFVLFLCIMPVLAQPDTVRVDCDLANEIIDEYGNLLIYSSGSSKRFAQIVEPLLGECFDESDEDTTPASQSNTFNEQSIRSLVSRYASSVKILEITQRDNTTTIEYDLKPQFLMRNEWVAESVVFQVICALQKGESIPHKLEFVGQSHFKSEVGQECTAPGVEIHISANNARRIVCWE